MPSRLMIVEGPEDLHSVVGLMKGHISWPDEKERRPVEIESAGSVQTILKNGFLTTYLKSPGLKSLGVMVDADEGPASRRYDRLKQVLGGTFDALPESLSPNGVITQSSGGLRLGIWIMPDNRSDGSLERFLIDLIPTSAEALRSHAWSSTDAARTDHGAPCRDCHIDKARLGTWLSWQDPPGRSPGVALMKQALDSQSPAASDFVAWFRNLYEL